MANIFLSVATQLCTYTTFLCSTSSKEYIPPTDPVYSFFHS